jgi:hypothetical protein
MYAYCFNDPIGLSDPTGLSAVVGAVDLVKNDEERLYVPLARLAIYPFANVVYSLSLDVEIKLKLRNGNVKVLFNKTFQGHPYIESRYSDLPALVDISKWLPRIPFKDLCGGIALTLDLDGSYRNQYGIPALVGSSSIVKTLE